jgi:F-type H+-transporting ATPase subunit delta
MVNTAEKYAKALFDIGIEKNILEKLKGDLSLFLDVIAENEQLRAVIMSPNFPKDIKTDLLKKILGSDTERHFVNFLCVLAERHREAEIDKIRDEFGKLYDVYTGLQDVRVISASPLDSSQEQKLKDMLSKKLSKKINLIKQTDGNMLGGLALKVSDMTVDDSVAAKLMNLRKELATC